MFVRVNKRSQKIPEGFFTPALLFTLIHPSYNLLRTSVPSSGLKGTGPRSMKWGNSDIGIDSYPN